MKLKIAITTIALLGVICFTNTSCDKKTDCIGKVICVDSLGGLMSGANVQLFADVKTATGGTVTADLRANGVTDASGQVSFTFKLPAIYDVRCSKPGAGGYLMTGASIIKLEIGQETDKTVVVR